MPAGLVVVVGTEFALGFAAQAHFKELDAKGIGHAQFPRHVGGCVALRGAGHTAIHLGQQNHLRCVAGEVGSAVFGEQAAFKVPRGGHEFLRQRHDLRHAAAFQGSHRRDVAQEGIMRFCGARGSKDFRALRL